MSGDEAVPSARAEARVTDAEFARRRRRRNVAIALALVAFVAIVFLATMAKIRHLLPPA